MRKIVHLSDIHFGTADEKVVEQVVAKIHELAPNVVVVSGDLTQRARSSEFRAAKVFLDRLPKPQIVVPGNHDVPLYNIYDRFFRPVNRFQKFITNNLTPSYIDDELAIVGVNTARSLTIKGGRISYEQVDAVRAKLGGLNDRILKIVVTHHPFDLPEGFDEDDIVGRAKKALQRIADCGGDVFLAGHLHVSNIETTAKRYKLENGTVALIIQAGTATSVRVRGEANSFNVLEFDWPHLRIERLECMTIEKGFVSAEHKIYEKIDRGWKRIEPEKGGGAA